MKLIKFPQRYLPRNLSRKDKKKQKQMLLKSRKLYKAKTYYTRGRVTSFKNKKSSHISDAQKMYNVQHVSANTELAQKTGCTLAALKQIVKKGVGAYYSSGSRPNQTPQSWGNARLASAITAGKAAAVDFDILAQGCNHKKRAFLLANKSRKKYKRWKKRT